MVTVSTRVTWVATSNNAQLDRDTVSRCITIKLDTNEENPEGREYARDPLQYIARHRAEVLTAILTLVRHWQAQGSPEYSGKCRSRFKRWEKIIGGILEANDVPGFLDNISTTRDNLDPETDAWREFVTAWHREHNTDYVTAAELLPLALKCEELAAIIGEKEGKPTRFGKMLLSKRDKVLANLKIIRASEKGNKGAKWRVSPVQRPQQPESDPETGQNSDDGDDGDDGLYPARNLKNDNSFNGTINENGFSDTPKGNATNVTNVTFGAEADESEDTY
jgi:hypothetical protein